MDYRYCDYRYYVDYIEIEWFKRLLSGPRRQNLLAPPLLGYIHVLGTCASLLYH
jgi:hypothetical protein